MQSWWMALMGTTREADTVVEQEVRRDHDGGLVMMRECCKSWRSLHFLHCGMDWAPFALLGVVAAPHHRLRA